MLYVPANTLIQKLRLLFKRRVQDSMPAVMGDGTGRCEVEDRKGYYYCRFPDGKDATGNVKYSPPFLARAAGAAFLVYENCPVHVAFGRNNEWQIVEGNYAALDQAGIDTRTLNPLHQQSKWVYLWQFTMGLATAVATTTNDSFRVSIKKYLHYVNNRFQFFETGEQADKINLASYVPAVDQHRYAAVWVDTYGNVAEVTTSTAQSLFTPLDSTDIQEVVTQRPPDAIPHKLFYLSNNQGTVTQQPANDVDARQFLHVPQIHGFPNPVEYRERIQPDRQQVVAGSLVVTGSLEVLGSLVNIGTGESGSGGTMSSFTVAADSGTPAVIENGETVTLSGDSTLTTVISGNTVEFHGTGMISRVLSANLTIPDTYSIVVPDYYKINASVILTLEGDACLEVV